MSENQEIKTGSQKVFAELIDFGKMLLFSFVFVALLTTFFFKPVRVEGTSMYPTLHDGAIGISNIISMNMGGISRFDVVIVYIPEQQKHLVKRVIALPNETISYQNDQLFINGEAMDEPFFSEDYRKSQLSKMNTYFTENFGPIVVGDGEYFVMGDNRPYSSDSRVYGTFNRKSIKSKDVYVLFPFDQFGIH